MYASRTIGPIFLVFCCLTAVTFSSETFAFSTCITSSNATHLAEIRALQKNGESGAGYYAKRSGDFLGASGREFTSLQASTRPFAMILFKFQNILHFTLVDFYYVRANEYALVFQFPGNDPTRVTVIKVKVDSWSITDCDNDGDGLADAWEMTYFDDLDEAGDGDPDGDGISNSDEYLAGTDPAQGGSIPEPGNYYTYDPLGRILSITRTD